MLLLLFSHSLINKYEIRSVLPITSGFLHIFPTDLAQALIVQHDFIGFHSSTTPNQRPAEYILSKISKIDRINIIRISVNYLHQNCQLRNNQ